MKKLIACLLLSVFVAGLTAQTEEKAVLMNENLGVVFSGGGALGLAHIGAIKALEEHGIQPKYVAGTMHRHH